MTHSVLFRVDASPYIGGGHAMRCLSLALELTARGTAVCFAMTEALTGFGATLSAHGIGLDWLSGPAGSRDDAMDVIALARKHAAKAIVVDGYRFTAEYRSRLKSGGLKLLVVDDYGNIGPYRNETVLNPNVTARSVLYAAEDSATFLLGPRYALLRPQFRSAARVCRPGTVQRILVTAGAADPMNITIPVLRAIEGLPLDGVSTDIVIGPGFRSMGRIEAAVGRSHRDIRLIESPPDMASLMAGADLCIAAAGSTLWELAALGRPTAALIVADNQVFGTRTFTQRGCGLAVDARRGVPRAVLERAVMRLARDRSMRVRMSRAGHRLVDGKGPARVAEALGIDGRVRSSG